MKFCSSNSVAAYSRAGRLLAKTARELAWGSRRGGFMGRWVSQHRFALIFCASLFFAMASRGYSSPAPPAHPETPAAQASPQQPGSSQSSPSESKTPEQTRTEQYTLSHERWTKAVAYSRAGYILYFVSYFLGGIFLFLILRLGWAVKFRAIAENVSDKKWVQGLVFVPLLFLTIAVLHLPLRMYLHSLSLHYEQSIQGWGSWFWDCTKEDFLTLVIGLALTPIFFTLIRPTPRPCG